jgi:MSHA pilin protein MshD
MAGHMLRHQSGYTLIELVVAITVLAIAVSGAVAALTTVALRSADAMVQEQATAIASAYLSEVLQKPFGAFDGHITRPTFDVVDDYAGLNNAGAQDQTGTLIPGLGQYTVVVNVSAGALGGVPAAQLREIDVTVTHTSGVVVVLSGYRTLYP